MKKTIQIILTVAIVLSLQACSDKKKNDYDFNVDTTNPQSPYYINHDDDRPMP